MDPKLLERYHSQAGAAAYRGKYRRSWIRRLSHRREMQIVRRALRRAGTRGVVLDCPCGAGRLAPVLLERAEHVRCVDVSEAMVEQARDALAPFVERGDVALHVASADALPFDDGDFDTAVCHRLIHHMADPEDRARVFAEMARVARRAIVISFSDDTTRKARSQRRRGVKRNRHTLTPQALHAEAAPHGLVPKGDPVRLNGMTSLVAIQVFDVVEPGA